MGAQHTGRQVPDPFTAGRRYAVIYADPPWQYRDQARAGQRGVHYKYGLLGNRDIAGLPLQDVAADDAMLFLWATWPKLPEVLPIIEAWGFRYRTCAFLWVKRSRQGDKLFWGMGNYTRANTEPCLLATRGRPRRISAAVHQVVEAPVGRHSAKPALVRERIVALAGDVARIELFARERARGWDAWGNDPGLDEPATMPADGSSFELMRHADPDALRGRVLALLARQGSIRRVEVEALCNIDGDAAARVLRALAAEGRVRRCGAGRGIRYELAGS